jgi:hypothetical protein
MLLDTASPVTVVRWAGPGRIRNLRPGGLSHSGSQPPAQELGMSGRVTVPPQPRLGLPAGPAARSHSAGGMQKRFLKKKIQDRCILPSVRERHPRPHRKGAAIKVLILRTHFRVYYAQLKKHSGVWAGTLRPLVPLCRPFEASRYLPLVRMYKS